MATDLFKLKTCKICPNLGVNHVGSSGPANASLMIIGQSPGAEEVKECKPFVGRCGKILNKLLETAKLQRDQVYITNVLKCRPPNNRLGAADEIRNCFVTWLQYEIEDINPQKILLLGKDAWQIFQFAPTEWQPPKIYHGLIHKTPRREYIFSYHPSYFLRRNKISEFLEIAKLL